MDQTPNLELPFIMAAQAQKHITHNEALRILDALVQLTVLDRDLTSPPPSPADGARYIVAVSASGSWSGHAGHIAAWQDGAWSFFAPDTGWAAWVADEAKLVAWSGSAWIAVVDAGLNPISLVGVNTTADATNRLAVSSPATLFGHEGAGHQLKINKHAASDTASVLLQTGFSGRAEVGTCGDDDLHVKVSADGTTWREALIVDKDTAEITATASNAGAVPLSLVEAASQTSALLCLGGSTGLPLFERPASKSANARNWRMWVGQYPYPGGGAGGEDYTNEVVALGWNLSGTLGVPAVPATSAIWEAWEYKFNIGGGGRYFHERHMEQVAANGLSHRFFSIAVPHDGGGGSIGQLGLDTFLFNNYAGTEAMRLVIGASSAIASFQFATAGGFEAEVNNYALVRQKNAAGTGYVNLPWIDSADRTVISSNIRHGGVAPTGGLPGLDLNFSGAVGDTGRLISCLATSDSGSANIDSLHFFAQTTGEFKAQFWNGKSSGAGSVLLNLQSESSSGLSYVRYCVRTGQQWSAGMNGSGHWVLAAASNLGSNNVFTVDKTNKNVAFSNPPKLPSYTVAGVPSASTYGAGSMIYVSDETGGAVPAFSDGSNWRRVTDRAVVS